ncbi:hypothetical protein ACFE04_020521 [Oxalis oulophora]
MEMNGRRSSYSLLNNQYPPDESSSLSGGPKSDWDSNSDHKFNHPINNNMYAAAAVSSTIGTGGGLQRQSSGSSSFGESSLSGEYYPSNAAVTEIDAAAAAAAAAGGFSYGYVKDGVGGGRRTPLSSLGKSWAQQTEESYQLQLALALRLSSEATCADDPNFLDSVSDDASSRGSSNSNTSNPQLIAHRFWVNGCLSYYDRVPDGFYLIHGMDPYVWTVCTDLNENGRIPTLELLRSVDSNTDSSIEVVLIDRRSDPGLKELQNRVQNISFNCVKTEEVVDQLAKLVCSRLGGSATNGEDDFLSIWKESSDDLKECLGTAVVPIGSLSVGLCRHRALLFKVLADSIDLPCRIAKGCKYCRRNDASSCLVRFGLDREYLVDIIGKPGCLCDPDSLLNGPSSISISSPLRCPRLKPAEPTVDFRSLAKQYFSDSQSLNLVFDLASTGNVVSEGDPGYSILKKQPPKMGEKNSFDEASQLPLPPKISRGAINDSIPLKQLPPIQPFLALSDQRPDTSRGMRYSDSVQLGPGKLNKEITLDVEDLDIPWSDLVLRERIGAGSFGTVHRAEWHGSLPTRVHSHNYERQKWLDTGVELRCLGGQLFSGTSKSFLKKPLVLAIFDGVKLTVFSKVPGSATSAHDVAVKILMEQDFHAERVNEFLREVAIMKRLRHPNIVLFMGAVTQPPNLSIVTEYLSRGSLYRLLHKPGAREVLDERRRLSMAYDVAKGMNYLHKRNPPIVHRDLKSPNLLVDKKYTVKVCDFGLSRLKANTFLSSKSAAGTPEWMAPEVLRDEPSNEKSDVYSFGVILWELATLQQPWGNLNPAQVVAAVGFKGKRLEIPRDLNPKVAALIEASWANEPWKRPSFASIMDSLRDLIKVPMPPSGCSELPLLA